MLSKRRQLAPTRIQGFPGSAFWIFVCLSLLLASCLDPQTQNHSEIELDSQLTPDPNLAEFPPVDLNKVVRATRPRKIVLVSQDGPKGHENIAARDCPEVVWCYTWQVAQKQGQELGVDMELAYVQQDCTHEEQCVHQQIRLLKTLAARTDIDGIIIGPRDSNRLVPAIEQAIANEIAVIALSTPINSPQVLTLVAFNDFAGGKKMGEWVSRQLQGQGNVLILEGPKYQKNALDRRRGYIAGLQDTNITLLDTETALWTCDAAQTITQNWLTKFSQIDAIVAASDHMALGALIATTHANRQDILIAGYDATPLAKAAIASGALGATIEQFPRATSPTAVQLMVRHLETGETFPPIVYLPEPNLISKATLREDITAQPVDFKVQSLTCDF